MSDLLIKFGCGADQQSDLSVLHGDLVMGNDLSTSIAMSLFTDARAPDDADIPDGSDPRGWWGEEIDYLRMGSLLWLLEGSNATPDTLKRAKKYAADSLKWLVSDKVVASIEVTTDYQGCCNNVLAIGVRVKMPNNKNIQWRWRYAWNLNKIEECEYIAQEC